MDKTTKVLYLISAALLIYFFGVEIGYTTYIDFERLNLTTKVVLPIISLLGVIVGVILAVTTVTSKFAMVGQTATCILASLLIFQAANAPVSKGMASIAILICLIAGVALVVSFTYFQKKT